VVVHPTLRIVLHNGASLATARIGKGIDLNGYRQYADLGRQRDNCMGNLERCPHGLTISFDVNPRVLSNNQHFISSGPYAIFYRNGRLHAEFRTPTKTWTTSASGIDRNQWQHVEVTWHEDRGLQMYINDQQVASTNNYQSHSPQDISDYKVYIGKPGGGRDGTYANGKIDEVEFWYAPRDVLGAFGVLADPAGE